MNNIFQVFMFCLIFCSQVAHSQIKSGLYTDCLDADCDSWWFINVYGDTATSEQFGMKHGSVGVYVNAYDTLIRQPSGSFVGAKYILQQQDDSLSITEKVVRAKRKLKIGLSVADANIMQQWNFIRNQLAMSKKDIYNRYSLMRNYLRKSSKGSEQRMVNAFNELLTKQSLDQQLFLKALEEFDYEYLPKVELE
jgi:hypothetical protein